MSISRLVADPLVGVRELQGVLVGWLNKQDTKDVWKLLSPGNNKEVTWKTAPHLELMAQEHVASLYAGLFQVCCNGVLPKGKLRKAVACVHQDVFKINFMAKIDDDFFDIIDERLRIIAAWFREVKNKSVAYDRLMRKASAKQNEVIDSVLAFLQPGPSEPMSLALVPHQPPPKKAEVPFSVACEPNSMASSSKSQKVAGIFQKILDKQESPEKDNPSSSSLAGLLVVNQNQAASSSIRSIVQVTEKKMLKVKFSESDVDSEEFLSMQTCRKYWGRTFQVLLLVFGLFLASKVNIFGQLLATRFPCEEGESKICTCGSSSMCGNQRFDSGREPCLC